MASGFGENRLFLVGRHLLDEIAEMNVRGKKKSRALHSFHRQSPMNENKPDLIAAQVEASGAF